MAEWVERNGLKLKILERVVHRQLYAYLQRHSILNAAQSGFRPHHTTQGVLVSTIDDWRHALEDKLMGCFHVSSRLRRILALSQTAIVHLKLHYHRATEHAQVITCGKGIWLHK